MKTLLKGMIISSLLLSTQANASAENIEESLKAIDDVKAVNSCFSDHRDNYLGFLDAVVIDQKQHYGRLARHVTVEKLSRKFSEQQYNKIKESVTCLLVTYQSDGTDVEGFILARKNLVKPMPLVVFNRGGNGNFGKQTILQMLRQLPLIKQGAIVIGSQYRQNDEFGGKDIDDVHQIIDIAKQLPQVKTGKISMIGVSRGGMTSYMVAKDRADVDSLVIWAGNSDLKKGLDFRPVMEKVYKHRIPNYEEEKEEQLQQRSAINWIDKLDHDIRILLLHGEQDKRVSVEHAKDMAVKLSKLDRTYKLVLFPSGDHFLKRERNQVNKEIVDWIFKPSLYN